MTLLHENIFIFVTEAICIGKRRGGDGNVLIIRRSRKTVLGDLRTKSLKVSSGGQYNPPADLAPLSPKGVVIDAMLY